MGWSLVIHCGLVILAAVSLQHVQMSDTQGISVAESVVYIPEEDVCLAYDWYVKVGVWG